MRINTNVPAMQANNALSRANNKATKSTQKLSTGLRINSAADDAAGMAVANKMKTQVRGLKMASRNSLDGISLIQTAEGALAEVQDMLQRIRELAIQSANDTLAPDDRYAIQKEVDQLKEEIKSTANLTEFNKIKLLNGDVDRRSFSNNNEVAKSIYVSDTVIPGTYQFEVVSKGQAAILNGGQITLPNTTSNTEGQGLSGRLTINGEEVKILETDTAEMIFQKIRDVGERVGINVTYDKGTPPASSFLGAQSLRFETLETGSDQQIEIYADDSDLLKALGLKETNPSQPVRGTDAVIKLISSKGEAMPASATADNVANLAGLPNDIIGKIKVNGTLVDINIPAGSTASEALEQINIALTAQNTGVTAEYDAAGMLVFSTTAAGAHVSLEISGDDFTDTAIADAFDVTNAVETSKINAVPAEPAKLTLSSIVVDSSGLATANVKGAFGLSINGAPAVDVFLDISAGDDVADKINDALLAAGLNTDVTATFNGTDAVELITTATGVAATIEAGPASSIYNILGELPPGREASYTLDASVWSAGAWDTAYPNTPLAINIYNPDGTVADTKPFSLEISAGATPEAVRDAINSALDTAYGGTGASPVRAEIDGSGSVVIAHIDGSTKFDITGDPPVSAPPDNAVLDLGLPDFSPITTLDDVILGGLVFDSSVPPVTTTAFKDYVEINGDNIYLEIDAGLTDTEVAFIINSALTTADPATTVSAVFDSSFNRIKLTDSALITVVPSTTSQIVPTSIGPVPGIDGAPVVPTSVELDLSAFLANPSDLTGSLMIDLDGVATQINFSLAETDGISDILAKLDQALIDAGLDSTVSVSNPGGNIIKFTDSAANDITVTAASTVNDTLNALGFSAPTTVDGSGGISVFSQSATVNCSGNRVVITDSNYQQMIIEIPLTDADVTNNTNIYNTNLNADPNDVFSSISQPTAGATLINKLVTLTVLDAGPLELQVGPNEGMRLEIQIPELSHKALGIDSMNLRTVTGATKAITQCDDAISQISALRSKLGAYQNRLEHTIANLETTNLNTTEALSRIQDTDMAEEMSKFTQQNIISQAGVSMLAQANQLPQQVLKLLQ